MSWNSGKENIRGVKNLEVTNGVVKSENGFLNCKFEIPAELNPIPPLETDPRHVIHIIFSLCCLLITIIRILRTILFKSFYSMNDKFLYRMNNFSVSRYLLNDVDRGQDQELNLDCWA